MDQIAHIKMVVSAAAAGHLKQSWSRENIFPSELKRRSNYKLTLSSAFMLITEVFMVCFGSECFDSFVLMLCTSSCRLT